jgi:hypothetical protein
MNVKFTLLTSATLGMLNSVPMNDLLLIILNVLVDSRRPLQTSKDWRIPLLINTVYDVYTHTIYRQSKHNTMVLLCIYIIVQNAMICFGLYRPSLGSWENLNRLFLPPSCTISQCSDMFRLDLLAIFREYSTGYRRFCYFVYCSDLDVAFPNNY